jgi:Cof subfamily protein (haloacid dehalogenase superfamily)
MKSTDRYLIALDLDHTLLKSDLTISDTTASYLAELTRQGHLVVIDTGRPERGLLFAYEKIQSNAPFISFNGGVIRNPKDSSFPVFKKSFNRQELIDLITYVGGEDSFVDLLVGNNEDVHLHAHIIETIFDKREFSGSNMTHGDIVHQISEENYVFLFQAKGEEVLQKIGTFTASGKTNLRVRYFNREHGVGELYLEGINKATGLEYVRSIYQIPRENVIAFGDSINDLEMLSYAGVGVCMSNGYEEAKAASQHISLADNDHDGIVLTLEKIFEQRKK